MGQNILTETLLRVGECYREIKGNLECFNMKLPYNNAAPQWEGLFYMEESPPHLKCSNQDSKPLAGNEVKGLEEV